MELFTDLLLGELQLKKTKKKTDEDEKVKLCFSASVSSSKSCDEQTLMWKLSLAKLFKMII